MEKKFLQTMDKVPWFFLTSLKFSFPPDFPWLYERQKFSIGFKKATITLVGPKGGESSIHERKKIRTWCW